MKYFAYGSNMDQAQMRERCPDSKLIGKAVINGYKIAFTIFSPKRHCGCADILKSEGERVWGLLYEISDSDLASLDMYEAHPHKYRRFTVDVKDDAGTTYVAETYEVAAKEGEFIKPSKHYLGIMQQAAKDFDFSTEYILTLSEVPTNDD